MTTAYNNAAGAAGGAVLPPDIGGSTLFPGVYKTTSAQPSLGITGNLTLDGVGANVRLSFGLPGRQLRIDTTGVVARVDDLHRIGVRFTHIGGRELQLIRDLIGSDDSESPPNLIQANLNQPGVLFIRWARLRLWQDQRSQLSRHFLSSPFSAYAAPVLRFFIPILITNS